MIHQRFPGGGLESEGEQIELVRIHEDDMDAFLMDEEKEKSAGMFMAMYWWRHLRHRKQTVC